MPYQYNPHNVDSNRVFYSLSSPEPIPKKTKQIITSRPSPKPQTPRARKVKSVTIVTPTTASKRLHHNGHHHHHQEEETRSQATTTTGTTANRQHKQNKPKNIDSQPIATIPTPKPRPKPHTNSNTKEEHDQLSKVFKAWKQFKDRKIQFREKVHQNWYRAVLFDNERMKRNTFYTWLEKIQDLKVTNYHGHIKNPSLNYRYMMKYAEDLDRFKTLGRCFDIWKGEKLSQRSKKLLSSEWPVIRKDLYMRSWRIRLREKQEQQHYQQSLEYLAGVFRRQRYWKLWQQRNLQRKNIAIYNAYRDHELLQKYLSLWKQKTVHSNIGSGVPNNGSSNNKNNGSGVDEIIRTKNKIMLKSLFTSWRNVSKNLKIGDLLVKEFRLRHFNHHCMVVWKNQRIGREAKYKKLVKTHYQMPVKAKIFRKWRHKVFVNSKLRKKQRELRVIIRNKNIDKKYQLFNGWRRCAFEVKLLGNKAQSSIATKDNSILRNYFKRWAKITEYRQGVTSISGSVRSANLKKNAMNSWKNIYEGLSDQSLTQQFSHACQQKRLQTLFDAWYRIINSTNILRIQAQEAEKKRELRLKKITFSQLSHVLLKRWHLKEMQCYITRRDALMARDAMRKLVVATQIRQHLRYQDFKLKSRVFQAWLQCMKNNQIVGNNDNDELDNEKSKYLQMTTQFRKRKFIKKWRESTLYHAHNEHCQLTSDVYGMDLVKDIFIEWLNVARMNTLDIERADDWCESNIISNALVQMMEKKFVMKAMIDNVTLFRKYHIWKRWWKASRKSVIRDRTVTLQAMTINAMTNIELHRERYIFLAWAKFARNQSELVNQTQLAHDLRVRQNTLSTWCQNYRYIKSTTSKAEMFEENRVKNMVKVAIGSWKSRAVNLEKANRTSVVLIEEEAIEKAFSRWKIKKKYIEAKKKEAQEVYNKKIVFSAFKAWYNICQTHTKYIEIAYETYRYSVLSRVLEIWMKKLSAGIQDANLVQRLREHHGQKLLEKAWKCMKSIVSERRSENQVIERVLPMFQKRMVNSFMTKDTDFEWDYAHQTALIKRSYQLWRSQMAKFVEYSQAAIIFNHNCESKFYRQCFGLWKLQTKIVVAKKRQEEAELVHEIQVGEMYVNFQNDKDIQTKADIFTKWTLLSKCISLEKNQDWNLLADCFFTWKNKANEYTQRHGIVGKKHVFQNWRSLAQDLIAATDAKCGSANHKHSQSLKRTHFKIWKNKNRKKVANVQQAEYKRKADAFNRRWKLRATFDKFLSKTRNYRTQIALTRRDNGPMMKHRLEQISHEIHQHNLLRNSVSLWKDALWQKNTLARSRQRFAITWNNDNVKRMCLLKWKDASQRPTRNDDFYSFV
ncbi:hypothetical protein H4219_005536 [Mycoemilia scoparia]|uniref:Sfi1 spindle body domain-containing protein n=1 Tax=Mycoemilia scoparia TaxID=417184 RepID=A0A9W7ZVQ3_9FUNG|nr:hypothetical protein H4219_005536 [Mycoemilia scoparia]